MSKDGSFCDGKSMALAPFPICFDHSMQVFKTFENAATMARALKRAEPSKNPEFDARMERRKEAFAEQLQVYYVRIGDYIKIGYTQNVRSRLHGLRVEPSALLATEPGGRPMEARRHREFAQWRDGRKENFEPVPELMAHIRRIREEHGEPKITSYPKVA
jgi:hypothetical protein